MHSATRLQVRSTAMSVSSRALLFISISSMRRSLCPDAKYTISFHVAKLSYIHACVWIFTAAVAVCQLGFMPEPV